MASPRTNVGPAPYWSTLPKPRRVRGRTRQHRLRILRFALRLFCLASATSGALALVAYVLLR